VYWSSKPPDGIPRYSTSSGYIIPWHLIPRYIFETGIPRITRRIAIDMWDGDVDSGKDTVSADPRSGEGCGTGHSRCPDQPRRNCVTLLIAQCACVWCAIGITTVANWRFYGQCCQLANPIHWWAEQIDTLVPIDDLFRSIRYVMFTSTNHRRRNKKKLTYFVIMSFLFVFSLTWYTACIRDVYQVYRRK